jgi:hypothetical protein
MARGTEYKKYNKKNLRICDGYWIVAEKKRIVPREDRNKTLQLPINTFIRARPHINFNELNIKPNTIYSGDEPKDSPYWNANELYEDKYCTNKEMDMECINFIGNATLFKKCRKGERIRFRRCRHFAVKQTDDISFCKIHDEIDKQYIKENKGGYFHLSGSEPIYEIAKERFNSDSSTQESHNCYDYALNNIKHSKSMCKSCYNNNNRDAVGCCEYAKSQPGKKGGMSEIIHIDNTTLNDIYEQIISLTPEQYKKYVKVYGKNTTVGQMILNNTSKKTNITEIDSSRAYTCENLIKRIKKDVPKMYTQKQTKQGFMKRCKDGFYKIFLGVQPGKTYHFYRQDSKGWWSHKDGSTKAGNLDHTGDFIYNPKYANRCYPRSDKTKRPLNYIDSCPFMCIPLKKPGEDVRSYPPRETIKSQKYLNNNYAIQNKRNELFKEQKYEYESIMKKNNKLNIKNNKKIPNGNIKNLPNIKNNKKIPNGNIKNLLNIKNNKKIPNVNINLQNIKYSLPNINFKKNNNRLLNIKNNNRLSNVNMNKLFNEDINLNQGLLNLLNSQKKVQNANVLLNK